MCIHMYVYIEVAMILGLKLISKYSYSYTYGEESEQHYVLRRRNFLTTCLHETTDVRTNYGNHYHTTMCYSYTLLRTCLSAS